MDVGRGAAERVKGLPCAPIKMATEKGMLGACSGPAQGLRAVTVMCKSVLGREVCISLHAPPPQAEKAVLTLC